MRRPGRAAGGARRPGPGPGRAPLGTEFLVNSYTTNGQYLGGLATDARGRFVVVWTGKNDDGAGYDVFAQRFDASGGPVGAEFRVNDATSGEQSTPAVSAGPAGDFVVAWSDYAGRDGDLTGVFAQRYDPAGQPLGGEFRAHTYTTGQQVAARVAIGPGGDFLLAWWGVGPDDDIGTFARKYDAAGVPQGPEFLVNTSVVLNQVQVDVALDSAGNPVFVWFDGAIENIFNLGIFGQRFTASGARRGAEFHVNTYTTSNQFTPGVAVDAAGNFLVVWSSMDQDGDQRGLYAQRFGGLLPSASWRSWPGAAW